MRIETVDNLVFDTDEQTKFSAGDIVSWDSQNHFKDLFYSGHPVRNICRQKVQEVIPVPAGELVFTCHSQWLVINGETYSAIFFKKEF